MASSNSTTFACGGISKGIPCRKKTRPCLAPAKVATENPGEKGLSVVEGFCNKITKKKDFSVPHIGWNSLTINRKSLDLIEDFSRDSYLSKYDYYFVHSFYASPLYEENIVASFDHPEGQLTAVIKKNNIIGFQFHPEKSGAVGLNILKNSIEKLS